MGSIEKFKIPSLRAKIEEYEKILQKSVVSFKELLQEFQQVHDVSENYKTELDAQREKCLSKKCSSSEVLHKTIQTKENIIQLAASISIRINESKDLSLISELFKVLCGEATTLTPPKESPENKENKFILKIPLSTPNSKKRTPIKTGCKKIVTPKKEFNSSVEDISVNEESIAEIDGTPGRTSPIFQSKKLKSSSSISSLSGKSNDSRDKKKCPNDWPTPDKKLMKLCASPWKGLGKGSLRQARLMLVSPKASYSVDLTNSPEALPPARLSQNPHVQLLFKKESSDNDDTILPSPTSGPTNIEFSKTASKDTLKPKNLSLLKKKSECIDENETHSPIIHIVEKRQKDFPRAKELEESMNILNPNRFLIKSPAKPIKIERRETPIKREPSPIERMDVDQSARINLEQRPIKMELSPMKRARNIDVNVTRCEESSMSILHHVNLLEGNKTAGEVCKSPVKRPLCENANIMNQPSSQMLSSMSILRPETTAAKVNLEQDAKRKLVEKVEPVYKEPTVRKKADKMALPGWCCEECQAFFGDLYEDDPDKVKAITDRCSRHRGKVNPARPKTPDGFWNPRWQVPEDTEEFNRRNNAV